MKRFLSLILAITLLLSLVPTGLFSITANAAYTYVDWDGPYYCKTWYYEDGSDYTQIEGCSTSLSGDVVIPDVLNNGGVGWICDSAFYGCNNITSIKMPNTISGIGQNAFANCTNLTSITIPSSVTTIKNYAFSNCNNLIIYCEASSAPSGWASNWNSSNCPVVWNYKNNNIASDGYIYVTIDGARYGIKGGTATVTKLPSDLNGEVVIPSYIKYKGIKYNVTDIGSSAFLSGSTITKITIPLNITGIGTGAFKNCTSLTDIWYEGSEQEYSSIVIGRNNTPLANAALHCDSCIQYNKQYSHNYDSCEDVSCNQCGYTRIISGHIYDDCFDRTCNICDFVRSEDHTYQNHADAECDVCGTTRVPSEHVYSNELDISCNECGEFRIVAGVYAIIYHLDGGTNAIKNPDSYMAEDSITLKDATKEGYTFEGWYLDKAKTQEITNISNRTGNIDVYAKFTANDYTATFNGNGADKLGKIKIILFSEETNENKTVYVEGGDSFNPYDYWTPTSSDYIFLGWTYNNSLINSSININKSADIEIQAKWKKNTTGDFVLNYNYQKKIDCQYNYSGDTISFYTTNEFCYISWSAYSGSYYTPFSTYKSSWSISTDKGNIESSYNHPGNRKSSAYIEPGTLVTVHCSMDKGAASYDVEGWINITCMSKRAYDGKLFASKDNQITEQKFDSIINAPSVSKTGYNFLGWYDSQDNQMTDTWQYTEDKTFTAKWQPQNYDITYELDGGTNSPSNPSSYTIEDAISLEDPIKPGYAFKGWYSDANFTTQVTSISKKTGNITLYAKFEVNSYNLILDANHGGFAPKVTFISDGVEIKQCYLYEQDTITVYRPDAKEGYIFAGWYTDDTFTSLFNFNGTIANDITLYAKWIECDNNIINVESAGNINATIQGKTEQLYAFVPLADGKITVTSESNNLDLYGILYDTSKNILISADDISNTDLDFTYTYSVKAGQLYYVAVKGNTASTKGQAVVNVVWTGDCTIKGTTYQNRQSTIVYGTNYKLPQKPIREGYVFLGWFDENDTEITDGMWDFVTDKTLTAKWEEATYHTVVFKNLAGNIISSETYYLSEDIVAPELPTKAPDKTYTYSAKWDNNFTGICTGDAVYSPIFEPEYINYTVTFKNWNGDVLSTKTYHYGDSIIIPNEPTKAADNTYTYAFAGWDKNVVNCFGDVTYTATYTPVYIEYPVVFKDWDGTVLSNKTYHYGDRIEIPKDPTRKTDNTYTYTFSGWDKDVIDCASNAIYTATYTPSYIDYTITFKNWDGTVLSDKTYHWGEKVTIPADPVREKDGYYDYTFIGWDKEVENCKGNTIYQAVFTKEHYHTYNSQIITPTCTAQGYTTHTCDCGDTYVDTYIEALGHDMGLWETVKAVTCTEDGTKRKDCSRCDHFETETIPSTGHNYTKVVTKPTCTDQGYTTHTCHCGDTYVDTYIEALGHTYTEVVTKPTCTNQGYTTHTCNCGDTYVDTYTDALGHTYIEVVTKPTCTNQGYTTHTCDCGDTYSDTYIEALGHDMGLWETVKAATCTEDGTKRKDCNRCDHFETETIPSTGHNYTKAVTKPTCTAKGYTTHTCDCGDTYADTYIEALGHDMGLWETVKVVTCTEDGAKRKDCNRCDHFETETIPSTGHNYTETETEIILCQNCGETTTDKELCGYIPVSTPKQLNSIRNNLSGKYYLTNDIVFKDEDFAEGGAFYNSGSGWTPIGGSFSYDIFTGMFTGIFDGNGYSIYNLQINAEANEYVDVGLFGVNRGTIKNLGMEDFQINLTLTADVHGSAGGVAGYNHGTIKNCFSIGKTTVDGFVGRGSAGGITGYTSSESIISECYNMGAIYGTYAAGGIAGCNTGFISDCFNTGFIHTDNPTQYNYAGGICGTNHDQVVNCYNVGYVTSNSQKGGITGICVSEPTISNCYYLDNISTGTGFDDEGTTKCTMDDFKSQNTFEGFDFDGIWTMGGNECYPYPELKSVEMLSDHVFDNACDVSCNCGYTRTITHDYKPMLDTENHFDKCVVCGNVNNMELHKFDNDCDVSCNTCDATRTITHTYTNTCDTSCNICSATRSITHNYATATCTKSKTCKVCGATSGKALGHTYTNSCDKSCNRCKATRSIKHTYTNACDTTCNICKATRSIKHSYKTTTTKATLKKNGSVVKKCTVCGNVASKTTIKYVKSIKLSATSYTYNGKVKTPTVTVKDSSGKTLKKNTDYTVTYAKDRKKVGTYKVTIKFKGNYSGTKTLTFKINPAKTTVSKLTAGKKSIAVNITKKSTQVTGYQIQYSTSKKFTNAKTKTIKSYKTTKYTLKGLSAKKTYYVRVRTYKTVGKVKYYSGWSTYKYVKTK